MINWIKSNIAFVLLIVLTSLTFTSILRSGYFPMHDDQQVVRLLQIDKCVKDGVFPCRWSPDLGYGYGYPQFNYYGPLPYYVMEVFHLIGFSFLDSSKIGFIIPIFLGAIGMYLLGKSLWGKWGGFLSGLIYSFAPYHAVDIYVRGAMSEFWALSLLPFVFWAILNNKTLILALSIASLILSHNITTFLFAPVVLIWMLINKRGLKGVVLGGLMSSFFLLPVIFEKKLVHTETLTQGYFNYLAHFASIKQLLLSSYWGYGTSELGSYDNISMSVGILTWTLALLAIFIAYKLKNKILNRISIFTLLAFSYLFLAHQKSSFVWNNFPFLEFVQFPWRLVGIAVFLFSIVIGSLAILSSKKNLTFVILIISGLMILMNVSFFKPSAWLDINDEEKFSGKSWNYQITSSIFDYLPITAKHPPTKEAPKNLIFVEGSGNSKLIEKRTISSKWKLTVDSQESKIQIPIMYFPNWKVYVNGNEIAFRTDNEIGLMELNLSKGEYEVYAVIKNTPIRTLGNALSLIGLIIFIYLLFK